MENDFLEEIELLFPTIDFYLYQGILVSLLKEKDDGNIEYKRHLRDLSPQRMNNLATQMSWRIGESENTNKAIYFIGVNDDGTIYGLDQLEIIDNIRNLLSIANIINAEINSIYVIDCSKSYILKCIITIEEPIEINPAWTWNLLHHKQSE